MNDEIKKAFAWARADYQARLDKGNDPMALKGAEWLTLFWSLCVVNEFMTDDEFAAKYELLTSQIVDDYMRSLPPDDPAKAQSDADSAEAKRRRDAELAQRSAQMAGESAPMLSYSDGRLSRDGERLHLWLEGALGGDGLDASEAVNQYTYWCAHGLPLATFFQTQFAGALWQMYANADDTEREAAIESARRDTFIDMSKVNTPDDLLRERARVNNLTRRPQFVKVAAEPDATETETEPDLSEQRRALASANTPEELQRALIDLHEAKNR